MFDYPQFRYGQVLLLQDDKLNSFTRVANRRSDVFYHLGRIDQAERWAHEVLTTQGFLGHALSRLVSIHVLKDQPRAARVYAGMMQKTLTHHSQGTDLIAQFEKGELLAADPEINALRPLLPKADHVGTWTSQDILTQQLLDAPTNRMAFEFLMAYLLIKGDIIGFGQKVSMIEAFGYRELPRAYEEACVCYTLVAKQPPPNLSLKVRDETAIRFARFMEIYKRYESNQREAWEVLKPEFGNTYWFFDLFRRSGSLPPPDFEVKS
jgi:hypothetical protein